jgi:hypothetical protein
MKILLEPKNCELIKKFYLREIICFYRVGIIEMADPDKFRLFHLLRLVVEIVLSPSLTTTRILC